MKKRYYSYKDCVKDCRVLKKSIAQFDPDALLLIARGGLSIGHLLSEGLNKREIYTINSIYYNEDKKLKKQKIFNIPNLSSLKKVVIVDDIIDSGDTIKEVLKLLQNRYPNCQFKTASIFYKTTACITPDFSVKEAKEWIDFFWEADLRE